MSEYENEAETALHSLARQLVTEVAAGQLAIELTAREDDAGYRQAGAFTPPPVPQWQPYGHTLVNPDNRRHLISGQPRQAIYGGPRIAEGAVSGQESPQEEPDGQPARHEIPEERLTRGQADSLHGEHPTADISMVPGKEAAAAPQRPARRPGRRSYYRGKFRGR